MTWAERKRQIQNDIRTEIIEEIELRISLNGPDSQDILTNLEDYLTELRETWSLRDPQKLCEY